LSLYKILYNLYLMFAIFAIWTPFAKKNNRFFPLFFFWCFSDVFCPLSSLLFAHSWKIHARENTHSTVTQDVRKQYRCININDASRCKQPVTCNQAFLSESNVAVYRPFSPQNTFCSDWSIVRTNAFGLRQYWKVCILIYLYKQTPNNPYDFVFKI